MKSTMYLYGEPATNFIELPYGIALLARLDAAKALRGELIKPHYELRDDERLNAVVKAIKHNEYLLAEICQKLGE